MRHPKNNIRSFRFSNEVAKILEDHNNDFEALVLECYYRLPEVEEEATKLDIEIRQLRDEKNKLENDLSYLKNLFGYVNDLERHFKRIIYNL